MIHSSRFDTETEAEACKLLQRALYIEPPTRPIDLSTVPMNGTEYIHLQRLLDSNLTYALVPNLVQHCPSPKPGDEMEDYRKKTSRIFKKYTKSLKKEKKSLKIKFPRKIPILKSEKEWCAFCLGSEMCSIIYNTQVLCTDSANAHSPLLSIVLHLHQCEIIILLKYHYKWFKKIGMIDGICEWVYALFACLKYPGVNGAVIILKTFYTVLEDYVTTCDESKKCQVNHIIGILENYFKLK